MPGDGHTVVGAAVDQQGVAVVGDRRVAVHAAVVVARAVVLRVADLARVAVAGRVPHVADGAAEGRRLLADQPAVGVVAVADLLLDGHRDRADGLDPGAVGLAHHQAVEVRLVPGDRERTRAAVAEDDAVGAGRLDVADLDGRTRRCRGRRRPTCPTRAAALVMAVQPSVVVGPSCVGRVGGDHDLRRHAGGRELRAEGGRSSALAVAGDRGRCGDRRGDVTAGVRSTDRRRAAWRSGRPRRRPHGC